MEIDNDSKYILISSVTGDGIFNITTSNVTKVVQDENSLLIWFHETTEDNEAWDMEFIFDDIEDATYSREVVEKEIRKSRIKRIK